MGSTRYGVANCDKCKHRVFGADYVANNHQACKLLHPTRVKFAADADHNPYADNRVAPVAVRCEDWTPSPQPLPIMHGFRVCECGCDQFYISAATKSTRGTCCRCLKIQEFPARTVFKLSA